MLSYSINHSQFRKLYRYLEAYLTKRMLSQGDNQILSKNAAEHLDLSSADSQYSDTEENQ